jgi:hypothetical protein
MKYCQGPKCHTYTTKDRIRGSKGDKHYQTRKRTSFYYLGGNACDMRCQSDWFTLHGQRAVDHFGRIHEPKRKNASNAWYKDYVWRGGGNDLHYFVNDLLGERRPITQEQYRDENLTTPNNLSQ